MIFRPFATLALALSLTACGGGSSQKFSTKGLIAPPSRCTVNPHRVGVIEEIDDVDGPRTCGVRNAWLIRSVRGVEFANTATVTCSLIGPIDRWFDESVQPAAQDAFGERVASVNVAGSYACRARNHKRRAKMSEHGYGNALDIASFTLESGRVVTVKQGWRGRSDERAFLRRARREACDIFNTVLGPGSDRQHDDHFHMDMQVRRSGSYCGKGV